MINIVEFLSIAQCTRNELVLCAILKRLYFFNPFFPSLKYVREAFFYGDDEVEEKPNSTAARS